MTHLIDRYLHAVLDRIPDAQRPDVAREVRAAIDEIVAQRLEAGDAEEEAVRGALTELGDPVKLAGSYHEERRYLIGPGWYPAYIEVLKRVVGISVAVVAVIAMMVSLANSDASIGDALADGISATYNTGVQVLLWVTAGFIIAERTIGSQGPGRPAADWTVDDLGDVPAPRQIGLGETIWSIAILLFFGGLVLVLQQRGVGTLVRGLSDDQERMALINPDPGTGWIAGFAALIAFSVVASIVRYARGVWTRAMLALTAVETVAWAAFMIALAASERIVNPALAAEFDDVDPAWWDAGGGANWIATLLILAIVGWELIEAWQGHRQLRSRHGLDAAHTGPGR